jgi:putative membrane protein
MKAGDCTVMQANNDSVNSSGGDSGSAKGPLLLVAAVSAVACAFLFWLIYFCPKSEVRPAWIDLMPYLNASFNGLAAVCLVQGYRNVKAKRLEQHRNWMLSAFGCSVLFLLSYVTYHAFHPESKFQGQGLIRPVYFFVLISHISLSIISLPAVLSSLFLGLTSRIETHRKIAKVTFPIWLYVSVTGVAIVAFLKLTGS